MATIYNDANLVNGFLNETDEGGNHYLFVIMNPEVFYLDVKGDDSAVCEVIQSPDGTLAVKLFIVDADNTGDTEVPVNNLTDDDIVAIEDLISKIED